MKGAKPKVDNIIPMKGGMGRAVPDAPDLMTASGKACWDRIAPVMLRQERLEPHHEDLFAAYCESVADVQELTVCIETEGRTFETKTRNGLQQKTTASWKARQDALANMQRIGALFGMSPVDDRRLASSAQGDFLGRLLEELDGAD